MVAIDADPATVELLYRALRDEGDERILPLAIDLADPSPGLGWRGLRAQRAGRAAAGRTWSSALALVHHLRSAANVPVREFVDWLGGLGAALVIEFPTREDPMVQKLLAPKRDGLHPDYELASSSAAWPRRSRSSAPSGWVGHARPLLRSAEAGMSATAPAARPVAARRDAALRATLWDYAHLAALSSFAVAQPLFALLHKSPEFLAARGALGFDIVSFAVILVVLPPALLLAVELIAGLVDRRARRALHLAFVAALAALVAAGAINRSGGVAGGVLLVLSAAIGIAAAAAYARIAVVKSFMNVLSAAPVLFLALFLFTAPVSGLAFPSQPGARSIPGTVRAPIVVVLFDELPLSSLMDDRGHVDAVRYPAFAKLERTSTWFRNAYAVYDSTEHAQPSIMDGNYPAAGELPIASDHPASLFTLFGKTHRMNVSEEATALCPRGLCEDPRLAEPYRERMKSMASDLGLVWLHMVSPAGLEAKLPSVSDNWGNFAGERGIPNSANVQANLTAARKGHSTTGSGR